MRGADHPMKPCRIERGRAAREKGTQREPSREPAAMHVASSSLPSEPGLFEKGSGEPSGQGTFRDEKKPSRSAPLRQAGRIKPFFDPREDDLVARAALEVIRLQNKAFANKPETLHEADGGQVPAVDSAERASVAGDRRGAKQNVNGTSRARCGRPGGRALRWR